MFVAWRDIRFARGRFLLIGAVVTLTTVLVGFLSGLTGGLAQQNISAITGLDADRVVFSAPDAGNQKSYGDSAVTSADEQTWSGQAGVTDVQPLGISQAKATGTRAASVAFFGVSARYRNLDLEPGTVALSTPAAKSLGAAVGQRVTVGDVSLQVTSIGGDDWYSHTPVVWMNLSDWQAHAQAAGQPDAFASVLLVHGTSDDAVSGTAPPGTVSSGVFGSLTAIGAFRSEIGSLLTMVVMLFGISALVIGAFFTVWTIQRKDDIAILKALGASNRMLVLDALGQALFVLTTGVLLGFALTAAAGALAGRVLPFMLSPLTTLLPATILIVLGLAGAAFALRTVTKADPLSALGSNR
ncbi:ABC transporter substrate-binding protein [Aeromicrobium sp. A1-2]|uniref:ABC transporter permease n=1 Tax=Aeromicrobium sp. A1-2 TaxID=2107713 RepID=UPI000E4BA2DE|nr:ABC transporter permease [Aeromicrobium sp. A1-2]AXT85025.1 ABC transporter substrate-binding protein [Aeromicrobium sp. A1-2]